jgi:hypothetical protein
MERRSEGRSGPDAVAQTSAGAQASAGALDRWSSGVTGGPSILRQVELHTSELAEKWPHRDDLGTLVGRTARWAIRAGEARGTARERRREPAR